MKVTLNRIDDNANFEATNKEGNKLLLDGLGGTNGVRPMQTLLMALGGCSGIDIVNILKKQRQTLKDFKIEIDGQREEGKEPSLYQNIHVHFTLSGDLEEDKVKRAIDLSMTKYCSVSKTLEKTAKITYAYTINHG